MIKGLESLSRIAKRLGTLKVDNDGGLYNSLGDMYEPYKIIEKELKRLEEIENSNLNEALECLDKLEECAEGMIDLPKSNWCDLAEDEAELHIKIMDWVETINFELFKGKQLLLKSQEQEKALEIIKNKSVLIDWLIDAKTLERYNRQVDDPWNKLTQEEFDILRSVYCNE